MTAGRGAQVPEDAWDLLRAAVNGAAKPPGPKAKAAQAKAKEAVEAPRPRPVSLTWQAYGRLLAPLGWLAGAQAAGWAGWAARPLAGGQVSVGIVMAAAGWASWRASRNALWVPGPGGGRGRARRVRAAGGVKLPPWALSRGYLAWCASAGIGWLLWAAWRGAGGGAVQVAWLAGGVALAVPHWHRRRRRAVPRVAAVLPGPVRPELEDPRLARFRALFCGKPPLAGAALGDFTVVPDGFAFELALADDSTGTRAAVEALRPGIAARYDVPLEQVSVEQSRVRRSERRARLTVLETVNAFERIQKWDGISTYDPETGMVDLGRYIDSTPARWLLHKPGSGAAGGVIAGVVGSGKTGSAHVLACESGLACLCAECGAARSCRECDPQRICTLWMGDPQMQPFGVWRGRSDLMAWGPEACVLMLLWAVVAMRARASFFGQMKWTDHMGRENTGKGWFDPSPQNRILKLMIDEWPLIVAHLLLGKVAVKCAGMIAKEGRKVGVPEDFLTQIPDLSELGERAVRELLKAFNAMSHRTDGLSKYMLGIEGDPAGLPAGVHGLGFLNGPDGRPAATMRTKYLPEYCKPGEVGPDVRGLSEQISRMPAELDDTVLAVLRPLGYQGCGQVLYSDDPALPRMLDAAIAAVFGDPGPVNPAAAGSASPVPSPGPVPLVAGPASLDAVSRVARAIGNGPAGGSELYDLMAATGLDALQVQRAAASLVAAGHAARSGNVFVPV